MYNLLKVLGLIVLASQAVHAEEVVRWVDDQGVTHFGNPQFAPAGDAEPIALAPANAMDAPDLSVLDHGAAGAGPNIRVLSRGAKKNPRGWRGYAGRATSARERTLSGGRR